MKAQRTKVLLDTHALIWVIDDVVASNARVGLENAAAVYVSAATVWEIEIKRALGRLAAPDDLLTTVDRSGFKRLPITFEHASEAGRLPLLHHDPFDRILIAQARLEGMTLATSDEALKRYEVPVFEIRQA